MPNFEINIKTTDDPRGVQDATEQTLKLTDAVGKLLEKSKRKEEFAAAKETIAGLTDEQKTAALESYQLAKSQEEVARTMEQTSGSAQKQTSLLGGLKSSWMEMYGFIGVVKEGLQVAKDVFNATAGEVVNLAAKGRLLQETIGATAEEATTLIAIGDDLKISTDSIQSSFEAAIRKGYDPSIAGLQKLRSEYQLIQDPIAKTNWLMDTFGRSGTDVRRMMELTTSEFEDMVVSAKESGQVLTQQQIDQARQYEIAADNIDDANMKMKIQLGNQFLPTITNVMNAELKRIDSMKEEHQWWQRLPGVASVYTLVLASQEGQAKKTAAAQGELNGQLAETNKQLGQLSTRGNLSDRTNYHAPGSEGYNPSGWVHTEGRASGGPVTAGRLYTINENRPWSGPEYFLAPSDGMIIPPNGVGQQSAGGAGSTPIQFVYAPQISLASRAEAERAFVPIVEAAMRSLGVNRG